MSRSVSVCLCRILLQPRCPVMCERTCSLRSRPRASEVHLPKESARGTRRRGPCRPGCVPQEAGRRHSKAGAHPPLRSGRKCGLSKPCGSGAGSQARSCPGSGGGTPDGACPERSLYRSTVNRCKGPSGSRDIVLMAGGRLLPRARGTRGRHVCRWIRTLGSAEPAASAAPRDQSAGRPPRARPLAADKAVVPQPL